MFFFLGGGGKAKWFPQKQNIFLFMMVISHGVKLLFASSLKSNIKSVVLADGHPIVSLGLWWTFSTWGIFLPFSGYINNVVLNFIMVKFAHVLTCNVVCNVGFSLALSCKSYI